MDLVFNESLLSLRDKLTTLLHVSSSEEERHIESKKNVLSFLNKLSEKDLSELYTYMSLKKMYDEFKNGGKIPNYMEFSKDMPLDKLFNELFDELKNSKIVSHYRHWESSVEYDEAVVKLANFLKIGEYNLSQVAQDNRIFKEISKKEALNLEKRILDSIKIEKYINIKKNMKYYTEFYVLSLVVKLGEDLSQNLGYYGANKVKSNVVVQRLLNTFFKESIEYSKTQGTGAVKNFSSIYLSKCFDMFKNDTYPIFKYCFDKIDVSGTSEYNLDFINVAMENVPKSATLQKSFLKKALKDNPHLFDTDITSALKDVSSNGENNVNINLSMTELYIKILLRLKKAKMDGDYLEMQKNPLAGFEKKTVTQIFIVNLYMLRDELKKFKIVVEHDFIKDGVMKISFNGDKVGSKLGVSHIKEMFKEVFNYTSYLDIIHINTYNKAGSMVMDFENEYRGAISQIASQYIMSMYMKADLNESKMKEDSKSDVKRKVSKF